MSVVINSTVRITLESGSGVTINAPVVPSFTTDDIYNVNNVSQTLTDVLDDKQPIIGDGAITVSSADVNTLLGAAAAGLVPADLTKLAAVNASAAEMNYLVGVTSAIQTQLNTLTSSKVTGAGVNLTGLTVSASQLNTFFNMALTVSATELNRLTGLTAIAADLNGLLGTASQVTPNDFIKLGDITATASEINSLSGFTGDSVDLNKLDGLTASQADLNALAGLAGMSVTATQLQYCSGLTQNVQAFMSAQPNLSGLTASAADLSLLAGAATGTGAFSGSSISATEISYLDGVTSKIQTQLDAKSALGHSHGIADISGASISTVELNYSQGLTGNIQSQLNTITSTYLPLTGGILTGALSIANGSNAAPSLRFANSTTTGFYRAGADQIGIAVAGAAFGSITASVVSFGNSTTGAPSMRPQTPAVTNPAYSFVGDTDTGIYRVGANSLGFAANGTNYLTIDSSAGITIGGAASLNTAVTIPGIFHGIKRLGSVAIDCTSTANFTLYTVPTGRSAVITAIYVVLTTVTGAGTLPSINVGTSGTYDQIVDGVTNANLFSSPVTVGTAGQVLPLGMGDNAFPAISGSSGAGYQILTAAQVLTVRTITPTTGYSAFAATVYAFGYEY